MEGYRGIDKVNGAVSSFLTENICWVCKAKMVANRMLEDEKTIIQAAITEAITPSGVKEVVINKDGQVIITPQPIEFVEPIVQVEVIP